MEIQQLSFFLEIETFFFISNEPPEICVYNEIFEQKKIIGFGVGTKHWKLHECQLFGGEWQKRRGQRADSWAYMTMPCNLENHGLS